MEPCSFQWIDSPSGWTGLCRRLSQEPEVALDTEADGFHHYFDKLCLLQISTRSGHFIVDPLALSGLDPLRPVLENPAIRKVFHAAEQDLMYLRRDHGLHVEGLFDTSIAAQLLGHDRLGLATLLQKYFEVTLSKTNQKDDWSRRPLTRRQLAYAIADTRWLLELSHRLEAELQEKGRLGWAREEFRHLEDKVETPAALDPGHLGRVKGWQDLGMRGRAVLKELLRARDREARRLDRPPFRIIGNATLQSIASDLPADLPALRSIKGFPRHRGDHLAALLMEAVRRGRESPPASIFADPARRKGEARRPARDAGFESRLTRLRRWRQEKAAALGLEPGVVAPQRDLEALAEAVPANQEALDQLQMVRRWRRAAFGGDWMLLLAAGHPASGNRDPAPHPSPAPGPDPKALDHLCRTEVQGLHRFLERWLTGRIEHTAVDFARLRDVLSAEFRFISPSGVLSGRDALLQTLYRAHGSRAGRSDPFRIRIENYHGIPLTRNLHLATYEEWHETGPGRQGRLSSALFRRRAGTPHGVEWVHVHEVSLPR
ncbi:MAG: HRDC domain-containing protein [Acidobacteriota bacterium]